MTRELRQERELLITCRMKEHSCITTDDEEDDVWSRQFDCKTFMIPRDLKSWHSPSIAVLFATEAYNWWTNIPWTRLEGAKANDSRIVFVMMTSVSVTPAKYASRSSFSSSRGRFTPDITSIVPFQIMISWPPFWLFLLSFLMISDGAARWTMDHNTLQKRNWRENVTVIQKWWTK